MKSDWSFSESLSLSRSKEDETSPVRINAGQRARWQPQQLKSPVSGVAIHVGLHGAAKGKARLTPRIHVCRPLRRCQTDMSYREHSETINHRPPSSCEAATCPTSRTVHEATDGPKQTAADSPRIPIKSPAELVMRLLVHSELNGHHCSASKEPRRENPQYRLNCRAMRK